MGWLINELLDLALVICIYISQAIEVLVDCLFYPLERIFYWLSAILNLIIECITGIINSLWNIFTIIYDFIGCIFSAILPYTLFLIIATGLTIVFLFRIYHFIKEIEILGNKI